MCVLYSSIYQKNVCAMTGTHKANKFWQTHFCSLVLKRPFQRSPLCLCWPFFGVLLGASLTKKQERATTHTNLVSAVVFIIAAAATAAAAATIFVVNVRIVFVIAIATNISTLW
jgi:hypothetical protein